MNRKPFNNLLTEFLSSERAGGFVLIACTILSLSLANSPAGHSYTAIWHTSIGGNPLEYWINDGLMAVFFLLVGLELKREILIGELSTLRKSLLPVFAATGGMIIPAIIYFMINRGTITSAGTGIPMATDIAFALGILSLCGPRIPAALKVFLTALAVIDDLGAILVIAIFYTADIMLDNLAISLAAWGALFLLQRLKVRFLSLYLAGGIVMWYFMLHSGVHATITGVLLAFVIPTDPDESRSVSHKLQHWLHKPVAFIILPLFALANTGIILEEGWWHSLTEPGGWGIIAGLVLGKPAGILVFSAIAISTGLSQQPSATGWKHIAGAGMLAGIGFTMSIFISLLAFKEPSLIINAKIAVLCASLVAALAGLAWLMLVVPASTDRLERD